MVESALIAAAATVVGVGGTVVVALFGFRSSRLANQAAIEEASKTTDKTVTAALDTNQATIKAAHKDIRRTVDATRGGQNGEWLISNGGLALTSRSSSPGANVTLETAGNHGNGFASQLWLQDGGGTYQNVKTGLFLQVRNNGPIMYQTVTTGKTATAWN